MIRKTAQLLFRYLHWIILIAIIYGAIWLRFTTANFDLILDYDPWWFFRHAREILDNGFVPPKWDLLSYYPPGRPFDFYLGWSYTIAIFFTITKMIIPAITLTKFAGLFVGVFAGFAAVPAYLVGRYVTNRWGGLVTAFFATVTPTFLSVSMAGYSDSDSVDVFYTFLAVFTTLYAIQKKSKLSIAIAVASYFLFALNWNSSWYIYYIFLAFIPFLIIFHIIEHFFNRTEKMSFGNLIKTKIKENKKLIYVILLIGIIGEAITFATYRWPFNTVPPHEQLIQGLHILTGESLIVNISVAELQVINVFSREGFFQVVGRIGLFPTILALLGLPLVTVYKLLKKQKIGTAEYFAIIWLIVSFWLITRGVRFSLLFSMAVATAAGFVVGNLIEYLRSHKQLFFISTVYAIIFFGSFLHFSENIQFVKASATGGLEVSQNWKDALNWLKINADKNSLITTWWDPGHIITGITGLKVHADGAHCGPDSCKPYDHNVRIQDMGRIFSISDEEEAINILQKYTSLSPQQCKLVKDTYGDLVPTNACDPISDMYVIASADLIGKYYWLSYFGTGTGRNYIQLDYSGQDQSGNLVYGGIITLGLRDNKIVPVINIPQQGITNAIIKEVVYYQDNTEQRATYANLTNTLDGLLYVDPSFRTVLYMSPEIRDGIFTKMFLFDGKGLTHFEQVFSNGELKIYKVIF